MRRCTGGAKCKRYIMLDCRIGGSIFVNPELHFRRVIVQSSGEGLIWACDYNGRLVTLDGGYGMFCMKDYHSVPIL